MSVLKQEVVDMVQNIIRDLGLENVTNIEIMTAQIEAIAETVSSLEYQLKVTINVKKTVEEVMESIKHTLKDEVNGT